MAPDVEVADLEKHLGYWMRFVSNTVSHSFRDRIAKLGVTVAEWVVLRTLWEHAPCPLKKVSEVTGVDAAVASRIVEKLFVKKLASRKSNGEDRRAIVIELTTKGKSLVPRIVKEADQNDAHFFDPLSPSDRSSLLRILKQLVYDHGLRTKPTE